MQRQARPAQIPRDKNHHQLERLSRTAIRGCARILYGIDLVPLVVLTHEIREHSGQRVNGRRPSAADRRPHRRIGSSAAISENWSIEVVRGSVREWSGCVGGLYDRRSESHGSAQGRITLYLGLLWAYYASQVFLFGAAFIAEYATPHGSQVGPTEEAAVVHAPSQGESLPQA